MSPQSTVNATEAPKKFKPYVPENMEMREFTFRAVMLGLVMTGILGAANAYLGLKAGMTIAAAGFGAAILLLTPLAFLLSTARNCRLLADILALVLGIALYPLAAQLNTGVDILISGASAGSIAYGVHWWRAQR